MIAPDYVAQRTLAQTVSMSGVGLFTGEQVSLSLHPAPVDSGIVFQRVDLPGKPLIPALLSHVCEAPRNTRLGVGSASIFMVEHLLSALYAYGIDNVLIEVEGSEIPAADGSARPFIDMVERGGVRSQEKSRNYIVLKKAIYWSKGDVHLIGLPSEKPRFSYTLHYPQSSLLRAQYFSFQLNPESYKIEIAPSRTFSLYEEILPFLDKGIIKGGGLENAVIIKNDQILNPEGTRFPDEMVRHKVLDLLGDLSLLGRPLCAHVIAVRSGHSSNVAFAKTVLEQIED